MIVMKILFYRYGSICENGVLDAFMYLGHDVTEIKEEISRKDVSPGECVALCNKELEKGSFDLIFTINYYPIISEVCRIYGIKYCSLIVDAPVLELYSHTVSNDCNRIFVFDKGLVEDIPRLCQKNVFVLPLCADFEQLDSVVRNATDVQKSKFSGDVAFVGSLYSEKCPYNRLPQMPEKIRGYLEGVIEAQLKVYGFNFIKQLLTPEIIDWFLENDKELYRFPEKADADYAGVISHSVVGMKVAEQERIRLLSALSELFDVNLYTGSDSAMMPKVHNCGRVQTYSEMPIVFHESKINLNMTAKPIQKGLPLRVFDVLACGGFLITNYQEQLPEVFEIGKDLEIYTSAEELAEKIDFYLKHDDLRQEIARNGYEKVKNNHTYRIRIKQMLDVL